MQTICARIKFIFLLNLLTIFATAGCENEPAENSTKQEKADSSGPAQEAEKVAPKKEGEPGSNGITVPDGKDIISLRFCDNSPDFDLFLEILRLRSDAQFKKLKEAIPTGALIETCNASGFPKVHLTIINGENISEHIIDDLSDLSAFTYKDGILIHGPESEELTAIGTEEILNFEWSGGIVGNVKGLLIESSDDQLFLGMNGSSKSWEPDQPEFETQRQKFDEILVKSVKLSESSHYFYDDCKKNSKIPFMQFGGPSDGSQDYLMTVSKHAFVPGIRSENTFGCHQVEGLDALKEALLIQFGL